MRDSDQRPIAMIEIGTRLSLLDALPHLHRSLVRLAPRWSTKMRIAADSRTQGTHVGDHRPEALGAAILGAAKPRDFDGPGRRLSDLSSAMVALEGATNDIAVFLDIGRGRNTEDGGGTGLRRIGRSWQFRNSIALQVDGEQVEGRDTDTWAQDCLTEFAGALRVDYGFACAPEEFEFENMDLSSGARALGRDISRYLPGLYWVSYFGSLYCDLIGKERLLSAPAYASESVADGILLRLSERSKDWMSAVYNDRKSRVLAHVGPRFFFSKEGTGAAYDAPDFGLPRAPSPPAPPVQVTIERNDEC